MLILLLIIIILSHSAVRNDVLIYIIDSSLLSKILSISDDELVFQYTSTKVTNFCRFLRWDSVWRKDTEVWSCITGKVWGGGAMLLRDLLADARSRSVPLQVLHFESGCETSLRTNRVSGNSKTGQVAGADGDGHGQLVLFTKPDHQNYAACASSRFSILC